MGMHKSKTIVITGGTTGMGFYCAQNVAVTSPDYHIIIASRNRKQAEEAIQVILRQTKNAQVEWMPLDLASLASVRSFVETFAVRKLPPLNAIVCNTGIQVVSGTSYTVDGFESTFGVNCLGHFLLVNLLLRHLVAPARIVFVSSDAHDPDHQMSLNRMIGKTPPHYSHARALAWPEQYPDAKNEKLSKLTIGMRRYAASKLCNVFYTYELSRRLEVGDFSTSEHPITVNAFNPGPTPGTSLTRDYGPVQRFVWNSLVPLFRSLIPEMNDPKTAGEQLARLVLDPGLARTTGKYFEKMNERPSSKESYDLQKAAELWDDSVNLVKLKPNETIL